MSRQMLSICAWYIVLYTLDTQIDYTRKQIVQRNIGKKNTVTEIIGFYLLWLLNVCIILDRLSWLVLHSSNFKSILISSHLCFCLLYDDKAFIESSLKDSEQVHMEDIVLCENVQKGLESPAYRCGRLELELQIL